MKQITAFFTLSFFTLLTLSQYQIFIRLNSTNRLESILVSSLFITFLLFLLLPLLRLITAPISFITFGFFNWLLILVVMLFWDLFLETVSIETTTLPANLTFGYSTTDIRLPYLAVVLCLAIMFRGIYIFAAWLTK